MFVSKVGLAESKNFAHSRMSNNSTSNFFIFCSRFDTNLSEKHFFNSFAHNLSISPFHFFLCNSQSEEEEMNHLIACDKPWSTDQPLGKGKINKSKIKPKLEHCIN